MVFCNANVLCELYFKHVYNTVYILFSLALTLTLVTFCFWSNEAGNLVSHSKTQSSFRLCTGMINYSAVCSCYLFPLSTAHQEILHSCAGVKYVYNNNNNINLQTVQVWWNLTYTGNWGQCRGSREQVVLGLSPIFGTCRGQHVAAHLLLTQRFPMCGINKVHFFNLFYIFQSLIAEL